MTDQPEWVPALARIYGNERVKTDGRFGDVCLALPTVAGRVTGDLLYVLPAEFLDGLRALHAETAE